MRDASDESACGGEPVNLTTSVSMFWATGLSMEPDAASDAVTFPTSVYVWLMSSGGPIT